MTKTFTITSYKGRNTAIRFVGGMNSYFPNTYVDLDDVEIDYTTNFGDGDPTPVDANQAGLHASGIRGGGVGVAVIDTGYWKLPGLDVDTKGTGRVAPHIARTLAS